MSSHIPLDLPYGIFFIVNHNAHILIDVLCEPTTEMQGCSVAKQPPYRRAYADSLN